MLFFVLFVLSSYNFVSESARILAVFPTPSISHQVVFRPLTQELAKNGHEVVILTPDPAFPKGETPANLTEIDLHDISYSIWSRIITLSSSERKTDLLLQLEIGLRIFSDIFEAQIKTDEVQRMLNDTNQTFDLLLLEAISIPALAFSHVFKAPVIQISSFTSIRGNFETIGAPIHPILYPEMLNHRLYNLTIWEKLNEMYKWLLIQNIYDDVEYFDDKLLKRIFGPDLPDLAELRNNVDMLFVNMHPIWEDNRPVPPGVVYIGGIHNNPEKELPKDLKTYLDSSKFGVIYVSFGTNCDLSLLPAERVQAMLKVFSKLPYDVLLKWNLDKIPGKPNNVRIAKWFPQADLLRHPKIKLFITQGGLQSTDEAISAGVPLIGIPMFADQWYNVEKYERHNIGIKLDVDFINEEVFEKAVSTVINDESYKSNVIRLRSIMQDQPQTPLERALWWIEYVLRHGGARHLRAPAANISWAQYYEVELVLVILICLLSALIFISSMAYFAYVCFCGSKVVKAPRLKDD